jgi:hypothetical protein
LTELNPKPKISEASQFYPIEQDIKSSYQSILLEKADQECFEIGWESQTDRAQEE